jgi:hypothetical protein
MHSTGCNICLARLNLFSSQVFNLQRIWQQISNWQSKLLIRWPGTGFTNLLLHVGLSRGGMQGTKEAEFEMTAKAGSEK